MDAVPDLLIRYDAQTDVLWIDGIAYAGLMFRQIALASPGSYMRIMERKDGTVTFRSFDEKMEKRFDKIVAIADAINHR